MLCYSRQYNWSIRYYEQGPLTPDKQQEKKVFKEKKKRRGKVMTMHCKIPSHRHILRKLQYCSKMHGEHKAPATM